MTQELITTPMLELKLINKEQADIGVCNGMSAALSGDLNTSQHTCFIKTSNGY